MLHRFLRPLAALTVLFPLAALPATASAQQAAPADWSTQVTELPSGGFLLGNPDAKHKLVEYFSYTCPHCAHFAEEADASLRADWVKPGLMSIEYRNYVRDGYDLTAALLAHCGGAPAFLGAHEAIFTNYEKWIKQAATYSQANKDKPQPEDRGKQFIDIADHVGLTDLVAKQGVAPAKLHQCLADKALLAQILELTAGAWDADPNFGGTPTFLLDGKPLDAHSWEALKPLLPAVKGEKVAAAKP